MKCAPDRKLLAQLLGAAYYLQLPPGITFQEPSWLANIEAAYTGCTQNNAYSDYLEMLEHWFAPAAETYMECLEDRDPNVSTRLLAVLTSVYDVTRYDSKHPALHAARHAAMRILGGKEAQ